jgi:hypothetical protein
LTDERLVGAGPGLSLADFMFICNRGSVAEKATPIRSSALLPRHFFDMSSKKVIRRGDLEESMPLMSDSDEEMLIVSIDVLGSGVERTLRLKLWYYDTGANLKAEIGVVTGLPHKDMQLYMASGEKIRDDRTLAWHRVKPDDKLRCCVESKRPRGSVGEIPLMKATSVAMSSASAAAPPTATSVAMSSASAAAPPTATAPALTSAPTATAPVPPSFFKIFVKISDSLTISKVVDSKMSMSAIRTMVEREEGVDLAGRKIVNESYHVLEDEITVAEALLVHGSTIVFHPRGCANCDRLLAMLQSTRQS